MVSAAAIAAGCGEDSPGESEKAADVEALNGALSQELAIVHAYARGTSLLRGRLAAVGREFGAHAQEHADAITKAIRGLGGKTETEPEEVDLSAVRGGTEFLRLAYELENAAFVTYFEAAPRLNTDAPQTLAASLAASHAQHLVVLRLGLGAHLADSAPEAFEPGDLPSPSSASPRG